MITLSIPGTAELQVPLSFPVLCSFFGSRDSVAWLSLGSLIIASQLDAGPNGAPSFVFERDANIGAYVLVSLFH